MRDATKPDTTKPDATKPDNATVRVRIENWYGDGHESEREVELPAPRDEIEWWWDDAVWPHTGDKNADDDALFYYTATIVAADDPTLVGRTHEWNG